MLLKTFEDLVVWQKAHQFVLKIYKETVVFPVDERFGLTSQIRRAAVSIAANIAEGFNRRHKKEKMQFNSIAKASLDEVHYYVILANDLGFWNKQLFENELDEIRKMLQGLINSIEKSNQF